MKVLQLNSSTEAIPNITEEDCLIVLNSPNLLELFPNGWFTEEDIFPERNFIEEDLLLEHVQSVLQNWPHEEGDIIATIKQWLIDEASFYQHQSCKRLRSGRCY